ncbi:hypothetical protein RRG08_054677 [Elysia crispata]|uniref:Uncharacterized protein n=1 Tax=Elysia crispata TaxID=231223 RepID=A0AAE1E9B6_9GAST|nr:hypothetical protein RRG08_054677 [Elysia crispata]
MFGGSDYETNSLTRQERWKGRWEGEGAKLVTTHVLETQQDDVGTVNNGTLPPADSADAVGSTTSRCMEGGMEDRGRANSDNVYVSEAHQDDDEPVNNGTSPPSTDCHEERQRQLLTSKGMSLNETMRNGNWFFFFGVGGATLNQLEDASVTERFVRLC